MSKFLIILLIILIGAFVGLSLVKRFIKKKIDSAFANVNKNVKQTQAKQSREKVVYEKDDIIVLKGEANENKDN